MARTDTLKNFLTDVADKFRAVLGTTDAIPHSEYDSKIDKVYDAGNQAEYDRFWNALQNNGNWTTGAYMFCGTYWNDGIYNPKYPVKVTEFTNLYRQCRITDTKVDVDLRLGSGTYVFEGAINLVRVPKLIVNINITFTGWFSKCSNLEEVYFEGEIAKNGLDMSSATKLNKASHISIINTLSTTTSGLTVTFSKTAVNNAFGIDVDDPTTYPEGSEFYELRNSRSNWTFSYK